ncbi:hypothetical protein ABID82_002451 [Methylobacterium sp. PvP062]|mgnify:CR=1 FL=1|uniref:DUF6894 domain-containing protein n=2 Tax=Methylobacterium radiotolerans TaxID=31998 RepID=B1LYZ6_METRJ|nr:MULTISPECIES: hypothetical protein [Methylobacterium]MBY0397192.1 hypothetical protein [Thermoleophilia bacterium]MCX7335917.1 hypothetical protein [Hyphomicrobiales bacterium]GAN50350.1 hypothetical protein ME121_4391 [Methylobacterium sp. ME121]ACB24417.1 hypothetical protein Mrad2831_2422 [Methylobacterium radiotolerans JCM 2831]KTS12217.1 hypothetical protein SB3_02120 [Methylobacterium radiotolerans]
MRYFTDFTDDRGLSRDEEGLPFADCHAACLSATEALVEAAQDRLRVRADRPAPGDAGLVLETRVRDATGSTVFRARLTLDLDWQAADG